MTDQRTDAWLMAAADRLGTPSFVYFTDAIARRIAQLDAAFGGRFALSFAVKANPNPTLLRWLEPRIAFLDISSIGEMRLALASGWPAARLSFTGPAKRSFELSEAIAAGLGELIVESLDEARAADAIAHALGRVQPILVRIAPDRVARGFGDQMAGRPCAFGIDIEDLGSTLPHILALRHLRVAGLHIYSGTQCLKTDVLIDHYRQLTDLCRDTCDRHGITAEKLVFGSGLGIPYHPGDVPLDLAAIGTAIVPDLDALRSEPAFERTCLTLELGRYLVGEAGYFLTRVVATKLSRGTRIAICDGGMNNHLPATGHFGMVIRRNYAMHKVGGYGPVEQVDLAGPLCTSIDRLASGVDLPHLEPGDLIAVHNSGAYGPSASPLHFISHAPPAELMVIDGALHDVSRDWAVAPVQPPRARLTTHDAA